MVDTKGGMSCLQTSGSGVNDDRGIAGTFYIQEILRDDKVGMLRKLDIPSLALYWSLLSNLLHQAKRE